MAELLGGESGTRRPNTSVLQLGDSVDRTGHGDVQGFAGRRGANPKETVIPVEGGLWEGRDIHVMQSERMTLVSINSGPPPPSLDWNSSVAFAYRFHAL